MLKLTRIGAIFFTAIVCLSTVLDAQTTPRQEYIIHLKALKAQTNSTSQTRPLADIFKTVPSKKTRPAESSVSNSLNNLFNPKSRPTGLLKKGPTNIRAVSAPKSAQVEVITGEALPIDEPPPVSIEPEIEPAPEAESIIEYENQRYPAASNYVLPVPEAESIIEYENQRYPAASNYVLPVPEDPTRFGYIDGQAFGFDNSRLYHPLEGPQLNLQGAPTSDFGDPGCDEWAGFVRFNELQHETSCGGLKAKPGHLGIPWLGSNDNCDQTVPPRKILPLNKHRRNCGCSSCQVQSEYDSDISTCPSCDGH